MMQVLTFILATWILFNLGMMSPSLPVAIAAQIFMGTTFVALVEQGNSWQMWLVMW